MFDTKEEQLKEMSRLKSEIDAAIYEAEKHANKYNLNFRINPACGMGGYYDGEEGEWNPSSRSC